MSGSTGKTNQPREAASFLDKSGRQTHQWMLTSTSINDVVNLRLGPDRVLPVIFVPGIMGSNLRSKARDKKDRKPVWRLDVTAGVPWSLTGKILEGPGQRQRALHPARCEVDDEGDVPNTRAGMYKDSAVYRARKWGEVSEGSYHTFLLWLEKTLNGRGWNPALWEDFSHASIGPMPKPGERPPEPRLFPGTPMRMRGLTSVVEKGDRPEPVLSDELMARARFMMPVHACGYNWLASNEDAAKDLKERILRIMAFYGSRCQQVVLVTHSMGGLVARRCAQLAGMTDKIAGVVHGVMPAEGAAVAYRRCKLGMADEGDGVMASVTSLIIGHTGRDVTAVFAQSPGALQLLPTANYRSGWLKLVDPQGASVMPPQPVSDPYEDIYLRRDRWWGLVREEWLAPKNGQPIKWKEYVDNIQKARKFHASVRSAYHTHTYVYYGSDPNQPSFETITWQIRPGMKPDNRLPPTRGSVYKLGMHQVRDSGSNPVYVGGRPVMVNPGISAMGIGPIIGPNYIETSYWELHCAPQDGQGDGTVPASSGAAPLQKGKHSHIRQQFRLTGFGHEASYHDPGAQQVTLYALVKIAAQARKPS